MRLDRQTIVRIIAPSILFLSTFFTWASAGPARVSLFSLVRSSLTLEFGFFQAVTVGLPGLAVIVGSAAAVVFARQGRGDALALRVIASAMAAYLAARLLLGIDIADFGIVSFDASLRIGLGSFLGAAAITVIGLDRYRPAALEGLLPEQHAA